ncbi:cellulose biosynthesis protein BcsP [Undibacterium sp. SXout20W]|uniref:cellulose biosynthesis protein BcsP n=1 Tax=Undibacterium sp. SXout20W TaxID=3413051 RepID=UPI003BF051E2
MDDDVKNLFQEFGQTTNSYQEINRDIDSEQAKQRWPLLRDVRVTEVPENFTHGADGVSYGAPVNEELAATYNPPSAPVLKVRPPAENVTPSIINQQVHTSSADSTIGADQFAAKTDLKKVPVLNFNTASSVFQGDERQLEVDARPVGYSAAQTFTSETSADGSSKGLFSSGNSSLSAKTQSVGDVFRRLVNQKEPVHGNESPVNSFFKKIFRP